MLASLPPTGGRVDSASHPTAKKKRRALGTLAEAQQVHRKHESRRVALWQTIRQ